MDPKIQNLKNNLSKLSVDELIGIWIDNNRYEYTDDAFEAIKLIMQEKGIEIPQQEEAKYSKNINNKRKIFAPSMKDIYGDKTEKRFYFFRMMVVFLLGCVVFLLFVFLFYKLKIFDNNGFSEYNILLVAFIIQPIVSFICSFIITLWMKKFPSIQLYALFIPSIFPSINAVLSSNEEFHFMYMTIPAYIISVLIGLYGGYLVKQIKHFS